MRTVYRLIFYSQILITTCWVLLGITGLFVLPILVKDGNAPKCTCVIVLYIIPLILNFINIKVINNSLNENRLSLKNMILILIPIVLSLFFINCLAGS